MRLQVNKKNKILFYFILFILFTTITNNNFYSIKNKLFKIDSIEIYGLKDKDKVQIIENLSYLFGTNLLFLELNNSAFSSGVSSPSDGKR